VPLELKNPHSVLAALDARPKDVNQIQWSQIGAKKSGEWEKVEKLANTLHINTGKLPEASRSSDKNTRSILAVAKIQDRQPVSLEELFTPISRAGLWIALDGVLDPHNVGAVFRTAAFFGVQGILLTRDRASPLTSTVYDVACGGLEYVPFAIEVNLRRSLEIAKKANIWILGSSERAEMNISEVDPDRSWLLVLGSEEQGLRRLTEEACDMVCRISGKGKLTSLNVSAAAAIFCSCHKNSVVLIKSRVLISQRTTFTH